MGLDSTNNRLYKFAYLLFKFNALSSLPLSKSKHILEIILGIIFAATDITP